MQADREASRAPLRPRRGRIAAALASVSVTAVSVLGGVGVLPVTAAAADTTRDAGDSSGASRPSAPAPERGEMSLSGAEARLTPGTGTAGTTPTSGGAAPAVPSDSGSGRRVVFDMSDQRVWLVDDATGEDVVARTYLVSGSLTDNLQPGTYDVYSRSLHATGIDDSGTMRYMVRFTSGDNAAIGFHDIPVDDGRPVQTRAELGTPQSHGCIRQWHTDAKALWRFAPVGTEVVVVA